MLSTNLCKKQLINRNFMRIKKLMPVEYDFVPNSWTFPWDFAEMTLAMNNPEIS